MHLKEFIQYYNVSFTSNEEIAFWYINPKLINENKNIPAIQDLHSILFVIDGELKIEVNGKIFLMNRNCFADINTIHKPTYRLLSASENLRAYHIIMTKEYVMRLVGNRRLFSTRYICERMNNPILQITPSNTGIFIKYLLDIKQIFKNEGHLFRTAILTHCLWNFLAEVANFSLHEKEKTPEEVGNKRKLYIQFLEMISTEINRKYSVNFYASRLCVTPQYLQRVVKMFSNRTVHQWIKEAIMGEIMKLLNETDMTIQQIAEDLGFPDQAALSKFFKQNKKVPPSIYRNKE
ncbi:MAG: helix-turn-helix domain-containing protein [Bacteroides fragilis]|nr:helix-turn-helix domain-containing protein [Bacteroides fragilis]